MTTVMIMDLTERLFYVKINNQINKAAVLTKGIMLYILAKDININEDEKIKLFAKVEVIPSVDLNSLT